MNWQWSLLALVLLGPSVFAEELSLQEPLNAAPGPAAPAPLVGDIGNPAPDGGCCELSAGDGAGRGRSGFLDGNHNFDKFIGFMSNPLFNIDPRAVTELMPITGWNWFSTAPALPNGNAWLVPSAAVTVALSERLAVGINQGGYATVDLHRGRPGLFLDFLGRLRNRIDFSGEREGWLDLGGFAQYTLIEDVPGQFLLTAGLRWTAPIGSNALFQGRGPPNLAPYLTAGKEFNCFHVLADFGFQFPAGPGGEKNLFYGSVHIDRRFFGWLYPLLEFNWIYHEATVPIDLDTRFGFINFGDFESTGNLVSMAVGADAVLIPSKVEIGAAYTFSIATQRHFSFDGLLLKMVLRY